MGRLGPTFGSAFAGIGGFELGLERAGWHCRWQIENAKFCNKILKKNWPDVGRWLDVQNFEPEPYEEWAVDLICGGFPCQDLSVAGKRGGLSGERSGLFWELVRMARELQPRWLLIENVPGFLSSNEGEDFALAIETLAECGYGLAWRVLDSQYFGVPQRRRRVFIAGHLGAPCPPEILFEPEGGEGDTQEGGKAGEDVAYCLSERPKRGVERSRETLIYGSKEPNIAPTLRSPDPNAPRGPDGKRRDGGPGEKIPVIAIELSKTKQTGLGIRKGIAFGLDSVTRQAVAQALSARDWRGHKRGDPLVCQKADPDGVREAPGVPRRVDLPVLAFDWQSGGDVRHNISEKHTSALHKSQTPAILTEQNEGFACDCPDSPRYRALGNAVTVQVAEWIGKRILEYDSTY